MLHTRYRAISIAVVAATAAFVGCHDVLTPVRPVRAGTTARLINPAGRVTVYPGDMHSWLFYNDQIDQACADTNVCKMTSGPGTAPLGSGSAELADSLSTDGKALLLPDYAGTRFDQITELRYSTYRQSPDSGNNLAISLQFNVDYDLNDTSTGWMGRLVFEPYLTSGGGVPQSTWQTWDAKAGKWWGTKSTVTKGNASVSNPCVQASPCTWSQVVSSFPNIGVHAAYGAVVLKAGSGWPRFRGNVDQLKIGVSGTTTTFDFELSAPTSVPATAPGSFPETYYGDTIRPAAIFAQAVMREIVIVRFKSGASQAARQSAIDAVAGTVVGGMQFPPEGIYFVKVTSDSSGGPLFAAIAKLDSMPQVSVAVPNSVLYNPVTYRRPNYGVGERSNDWRLSPDSAFGDRSRKSWALEAINAPFAWGCSTGGNTRVGVLDMGVHAWGSITSNIDTVGRTYAAHTVPGMTDPFEHGSQVASAIAARGNDTGITGVMWSAKLTLADVAQKDSATGLPTVVKHGPISWTQFIIEGLALMANRHVRILNVSLGENELPNPLPPDSVVTFTRLQYAKIGRDVRDQMTVLGGQAPLFVISAGNMGNTADAKYSWPTAFADGIPSNESLIVTAASANANSIASFATGVGNITIAAPGDSVAVMDSTTGVHQVNGSSFATALASGAAGLVFAFDSSLTAAQVRTFILLGAARGHRVAGVYPLLDAYQALRVAASQHGAPLCGNRLWLDSAQTIVAERNDSTHADDEPLITTTGGDYSNSFVNAYHGGHRFDLNFSREFRYDVPSRTWQEHTPWTAPTSDQVIGGAFKSSNYQQDHDDSLSIHSSITGTGASTAVNLSVQLGHSPYTQLFTLPTYTVPVTPPDSVCIQEQPAFDSTGTFLGYPTCNAYEKDGTWTELFGAGSNFFSAIAPRGDYAVVPLSVIADTVRHETDFHACSGDTRPHPAMCRLKTQNSEGSVRYQLLRADLIQRTWSLMPVATGGVTEIQNKYVSWLSISERGDEVTMQTAVFRYDLLNNTLDCSQGQHTFLATPNASVAAGTPLRTVYLSSNRLCNFIFDSGSTIAPIRRPSTPGIKP